jgi:hypothetical protein
LKLEEETFPNMVRTKNKMVTFRKDEHSEDKLESSESKTRNTKQITMPQNNTVIGVKITQWNPEDKKKKQPQPAHKSNMYKFKVNIRNNLVACSKETQARRERKELAAQQQLVNIEQSAASMPMPMSNQYTPISNQYTLMSNQNTLMSNQNSQSNQYTPISNQYTPMSNQNSLCDAFETISQSLPPLFQQQGDSINQGDLLPKNSNGNLFDDGFDLQSLLNMDCSPCMLSIEVLEQLLMC